MEAPNGCIKRGNRRAGCRRYGALPRRLRRRAQTNPPFFVWHASCSFAYMTVSAEVKLKVLLLDADASRAAGVRGSLRALGYEVVGSIASGARLYMEVARLNPDVVIIDVNSPDRDTLEHLCCLSRDAPRPVVMFAHDDDKAKIRAAIQAGVSAYVVRGLSADRIQPIVEVAIARFEEHRSLRAEIAAVRARLDDRKLVERAKGVVMQRNGCSENEAYCTLRQLAMTQQQSLGDVARALLAGQG